MPLSFYIHLFPSILNIISVSLLIISLQSIASDPGRARMFWVQFIAYY
jgi:hypothetical protein